MDPTGFAEVIVNLIEHRHFRTGIAIVIAYLGGTLVQWSINAPMPQEAILIVAGIAFLVGGGAYVLWRVWDE